MLKYFTLLAIIYEFHGQSVTTGVCCIGYCCDKVSGTPFEKFQKDSNQSFSRQGPTLREGMGCDTPPRHASVVSLATPVAKMVKSH